MNAGESKGKNKIKLAALIIVVFALVIVSGLYYFYSKTGSMPTDGQFITGENLEDFIKEQEENGYEVQFAE